MSTRQLIIQNLKANLRHYYLYVFALIFSVALYFAFVTLQYDPAMDRTQGDIKGAAAIRAASVLLVAIVTIFNLYANNIFVKRRGREIGLLQLIGMTKGRIFRILSTENFILYFGSLTAGTLIGFSMSKLILMVLFRLTGVQSGAELNFSLPALVQTLLVFGAVYLFILLVNYIFIQRQSILSLFRVSAVAEDRVKPISLIEQTIGWIGLALIVLGYYVSSRLFGGDFTTMTALFLAMIFILGTVIIGTYLFYKGSVRLILHFIRKRKNGYLNVREVLSLSSIMFRMKSNALLLTVITTVSALAIGLLSLSYIAYYSTDKLAERQVPAHFSITKREDAEQFKAALAASGIAHRETAIEVIQIEANLSSVIETNLQGFQSDGIRMPVISEQHTGLDLAGDQVMLFGSNDLLMRFLNFKESGSLVLRGRQLAIPQTYTGLEKQNLISSYFLYGNNLPAAVVDDAVFQQLKGDLDPAIQKESSLYIGIDLTDKAQLEQANQIFSELGFDRSPSHDSRLNVSTSQKKLMGLTMFIVAFLGLTFLVTSGCILYFKQMDESEEEKPTYTILRKLGYTQGDLLQGIRLKQLFNFGIPLIVGLLHSYFAVQSGWFFFGAELWTPMILVMALYTALYSVFGILSVLHYRKVIRGAL